VGTRLPAYATSMGRVLLAGLPGDRLDAYLGAATITPLTERTIVDLDRLRAEVERTRIRGWCLVDQELEDGVRSIAVPIHNSAGRVVAAVNTSAHATRAPLATLHKSFLPKLRDCAAAIDTELRSVR